MKEGCRNWASLSKGLHEGDVEGELLYWGPQKISKAVKMGICFHRAPLLGNVEGRSFLRAFERRGK